MATNSQIAFNPQGETVVVAAAVAPPLGVQVPVYEKFSSHVAGQMRIVNASNNTVHLGFGTTAATSSAKRRSLSMVCSRSGPLASGIQTPH